MWGRRRGTVFVHGVTHIGIAVVVVLVGLGRLLSPKVGILGHRSGLQLFNCGFCGLQVFDKIFASLGYLGPDVFWRAT